MVSGAQISVIVNVWRCLWVMRCSPLSRWFAVGDSVVLWINCWFGCIDLSCNGDDGCNVFASLYYVASLFNGVVFGVAAIVVAIVIPNSIVSAGFYIHF